MTGLTMDRKWLWLAVAGAVLVVIVAAVLAAPYLTQPGGTDDGSTASSTPGGAAAGSGQSADGVIMPGNVDASAAVTATSTDGTGAKGGSKPTGGPSATASSQQAGTFYLRIMWWNDTKTRAAKNVVVDWGSGGSWSPDPALPSQAVTIGPFPVDTALSLTVYPDGKSGTKAVVPFTITPVMRSGTERDGVHIELRDDALRVLGNPVQNFERVFER
jgi:hypothetical protein